MKSNWNYCASKISKPILKTFNPSKKTARQEIDREVEELKLGFSETATKNLRNLHLIFEIAN